MSPHADRDPLPEPEWRETSSPGIRLWARMQVEAAVRKAKERRTPTATEGN